MQREAEKIVLRQLNHRLRAIEPSLEQRVRELPLDRIEALSEALLDFTEISDARELVEPSLRQITKIVRARSPALQLLIPLAKQDFGAA